MGAFIASRWVCQRSRYSAFVRNFDESSEVVASGPWFAVNPSGRGGHDPVRIASIMRRSDEIRCPSCQAMGFIPSTGRSRRSASLKSLR